MAVVLRLRREGKKKQPFYRIVATDERFPRDGRFIEIVGQVNPLVDPEEVNVKKDRFVYWMSVGAKPSNTLKNVLTRVGMWKDLLAELENVHSQPKAVDTPIEPETEAQTETEKEES